MTHIQVEVLHRQYTTSVECCNRFSNYYASLAEERKKKEEDRQFGRLATYRCGTPAMVSNSLVADKNTRDCLVWLIKACDYI